MYKYLFKTFYNRINKKEYNLQTWEYYIYYINIIAMKKVITVAEKGRESKRSLTIEKIKKTLIAKVAKILNIIDPGSYIIGELAMLT